MAQKNAPSTPVRAARNPYSDWQDQTPLLQQEMTQSRWDLMDEDDLRWDVEPTMLRAAAKDHQKQKRRRPNSLPRETASGSQDAAF